MKKIGGSPTDAGDAAARAVLKLGGSEENALKAALSPEDPNADEMAVKANVHDHLNKVVPHADGTRIPNRLKASDTVCCSTTSICISHAFSVL